jgi:hypothetical protein
MIDKTVNYLQEIELLKKIEPIAERMGLEEDALVPYFLLSIDVGTGKESFMQEKPFIGVNDTFLFEDYDNKSDKDIVISKGHRGGQLYYMQKQLQQETGKPFDKVVKTYTSSSLELLLPEWVNIYVEVDVIEHDDIDVYFWSTDLGNKVKVFNGFDNKEAYHLRNQISFLLEKISVKRGKEKVEALARLIILLDENDLLAVKNEKHS